MLIVGIAQSNPSGFGGHFAGVGKSVVIKKFTQIGITPPANPDPRALTDIRVSLTGTL